VSVECCCSCAARLMRWITTMTITTSIHSSQSNHRPNLLYMLLFSTCCCSCAARLTC
jgi:hypothetical protein